MKRMLGYTGKLVIVAFMCLFMPLGLGLAFAKGASTEGGTTEIVTVFGMSLLNSWGYVWALMQFPKFWWKWRKQAVKAQAATKKDELPNGVCYAELVRWGEGVDINSEWAAKRRGNAVRV